MAGFNPRPGGGYMPSYAGVDPALQEQLDAAEARRIPTIGEQSVNPDTETAINQASTGFNSLSVDPMTRQAQMRALSDLQGVGHGGALDATAKAQEIEAQQDAAAQERGQRQALAQSMAMRGLSGGGQELAMNLAGQQGAAQTSGLAGYAAAGGAQQRALQAIAQSGQLAGQVHGQDYQEAANKAQAQDAINRFNAANQQGVQQRNVAGRNQSKYYNKGLYQTRFGNAMGVANFNNQVNQQNTDRQRQDEAAAAGAVGTLVGTGVGMYGRK